MQNVTVIELLYQQDSQNMIYNALPRTLPPGYFFGPHCHENVEVCLMRGGECDIAVNGEDITVHEGEMMIIFSHMIHTFHVKTTTPAEFLQVHFQPAAFLKADVKVSKNLKFIHYMTNPRSAYLFRPFSRQLLSCVERICEEIDNESEAFHTALANIYVDEMVILLSREIEQEFRGVFNIENPVAVKAIQFIGENIDGCVTSKDVAEACKVSGRYMTKIFSKYIHFSVNDYINIAKIDKAMQLLHTSGLNMTQIASKLGFSSAQYFSTVFKRYTGVTPSEFKTRENKNI